tara:strand:- start:45 stop:1085 length:1041 start_codon:yes stop_codon:yes gene_type:complete
MARPRSLNFDIFFEKKDTNKKITVDGEEITEKFSKTISLTKVDDKFTFLIDGFTYHEPNSHLITYIKLQDKKFNLSGLAKYKVQNNKFVEDHELLLEDKMYLNGTLDICFLSDWFKHHLFDGMCSINTRSKGFTGTTGKTHNQYDSLRETDLAEYDIGCFGASFTYGPGVERSQTWPAVLGNLTQKYTANFGVEGLDHYSTLCNVDYALDRYRLEQVVILLPVNKFLPYRVNFLNAKVNLMTGHQFPYNKFFGKEITAWMKKNILHESRINNFLMKKMKQVEQKCNNLGIKLDLIYQRKDELTNIYKESIVHDFTFPELDKNVIADGYHPNKNLYEQFAETLAGAI